jgi:hypothetical protein
MRKQAAAASEPQAPNRGRWSTASRGAPRWVPLEHAVDASPRANERLVTESTSIFPSARHPSRGPRRRKDLRSGHEFESLSSPRFREQRRQRGVRASLRAGALPSEKHDAFRRIVRRQGNPRLVVLGPCATSPRKGGCIARLAASSARIGNGARIPRSTGCRAAPRHSSSQLLCDGALPRVMRGRANEIHTFSAGCAHDRSLLQKSIDDVSPRNARKRDTDAAPEGASPKRTNAAGERRLEHAARNQFIANVRVLTMKSTRTPKACASRLQPAKASCGRVGSIDGRRSGSLRIARFSRGARLQGIFAEPDADSVACRRGADTAR